MSKLRKRDNDPYADWLQNYGYQFFCTFTTRYELTLRSARRLMERTHDKYKKHFGYCHLFWVAEKFEAKDGYHTHALLKVNPDALTSKGLLRKNEFQSACELYQMMTGAKIKKNDKGKLIFDQWNRLDIQRFKYEKHAGKYCVKYIQKNKNSGLSDYDILT